MVQLHFDFAELRGYGYHTGLVFAAYAPGNWQAIAKGGRYDEIGAVFGRSRPATGFSLDLNMLLRLNNNNQDTQASGIFAPAEEDSDLEKIIQGLRQQGERVIRELPGQQLDMNELGCDRKLVKKAQQWQVERLT
ncbi:MAG: ATP phosphoribosyltransferase regulatory subunit, partial [Gammaproteobacteria bacterium]|nr:ATP phosphoribosyltransferase regulatory subunit [Gammaproteobacteria bacterium]